MAAESRFSCSRYCGLDAEAPPPIPSEPEIAAEPRTSSRCIGEAVPRPSMPVASVTPAPDANVVHAGGALSWNAQIDAASRGDAGFAVTDTAVTIRRTALIVAPESAAAVVVGQVDDVAAFAGLYATVAYVASSAVHVRPPSEDPASTQHVGCPAGAPLDPVDSCGTIEYDDGDATTPAPPSDSCTQSPEYVVPPTTVVGTCLPLPGGRSANPLIAVYPGEDAQQIPVVLPSAFWPLNGTYAVAWPLLAVAAYDPPPYRTLLSAHVCVCVCVCVCAPVENRGAGGKGNAELLENGLDEAPVETTETPIVPGYDADIPRSTPPVALRHAAGSPAAALVTVSASPPPAAFDSDTSTPADASEASTFAAATTWATPGWEKTRDRQGRNASFEAETAVLDPHRPALDPHEAVLDPHSPVLDAHAPVLDPHSPALDANWAALEAQEDVLEPHRPALEAKSAALEPQKAVLDPHSPALDPNSAALEPHAPVLDPHSPALEANWAAFEPQKAVLDPQRPALDPNSAALEPQKAVFEPHSPALDPNSAALDPHSAALELQTDVLEPHAAALDPHWAALEPHWAALEPQSAELEPQTAVFEPQRAVFELQTAALEPQTAVLHPLYAAFEPQAAELEPQTAALHPL